MPAFRALPALTLILAILACTVTSSVAAEPGYQSYEAGTPALTRALSWLASNQHSNGSYGPYSEVQAAPAAYALWLNASSSPRAKATFTWLASELDDETSGLWAFPEADIPGEILYTISLTNNLGLLAQDSTGYQLLLDMQQLDGGFKGFYDDNGNQISTSVDTAMALWGLKHAQQIPVSNQSAAVNFLLTLQNSDGSFNLAPAITSNQYASLGPEPVSITALVILVLKDVSYTGSDPNVSRALNYLSQAASGNFSGHVYAAALSALAFKAVGKPADASKAVSFILSSQNDDGGFSDVIRSLGASNALDTGWASIALQLVQPEPLRSPALNPLVLTVLVASVAVPVVALLGAVVFFHRRKRKVLTPA